MSHKLKLWLIITGVVVLPLIIGAVYLQRTARSEASASCPPDNIHTERVSPSAARVQFDTECLVKAKVFCAIGRDGIQFLCGEDDVETTTHIINTSEVTLSSNTPYYVFIDTQLEKKSLAYIQASPSDPTVGLDFNLYNEDTMGLKSDSPEYDVRLDLNQDGIINGMDQSEFYH